MANCILNPFHSRTRNEQGFAVDVIRFEDYAAEVLLRDSRPKIQYAVEDDVEQADSQVNVEQTDSSFDDGILAPIDVARVASQRLEESALLYVDRMCLQEDEISLSSNSDIDSASLASSAYDDLSNASGECRSWLSRSIISQSKVSINVVHESTLNSPEKRVVPERSKAEKSRRATLFLEQLKKLKCAMKDSKIVLDDAYENETKKTVSETSRNSSKEDVFNNLKRLKCAKKTGSNFDSNDDNPSIALATQPSLTQLVDQAKKLNCVRKDFNISCKKVDFNLVEAFEDGREAQGTEIYHDKMQVPSIGSRRKNFSLKKSSAQEKESSARDPGDTCDASFGEFEDENVPYYDSGSEERQISSLERGKTRRTKKKKTAEDRMPLLSKEPESTQTPSSIQMSRTSSIVSELSSPAVLEDTDSLGTASVMEVNESLSRIRRDLSRECFSNNFNVRNTVLSSLVNVASSLEAAKDENAMRRELKSWLGSMEKTLAGDPEQEAAPQCDDDDVELNSFSGEETEFTPFERWLGSTTSYDETDDESRSFDESLLDDEKSIGQRSQLSSVEEVMDTLIGGIMNLFSRTNTMEQTSSPYEDHWNCANRNEYDSFSDSVDSKQPKSNLGGKENNDDWLDKSNAFQPRRVGQERRPKRKKKKKRSSQKSMESHKEQGMIGSQSNQNNSRGAMTKNLCRRERSNSSKKKRAVPLESMLDAPSRPDSREKKSMSPWTRSDLWSLSSMGSEMDSEKADENSLDLSLFFVQESSDDTSQQKLDSDPNRATIASSLPDDERYRFVGDGFGVI